VSYSDAQATAANAAMDKYRGAKMPKLVLPSLSWD
jgi:hypothetical protein